jgi:hypothetical protein
MKNQSISHGRLSPDALPVYRRAEASRQPTNESKGAKLALSAHAKKIAELAWARWAAVKKQERRNRRDKKKEPVLGGTGL